MNRTTALRTLADAARWDFLVIGGGATGLSVALDAAARGFRTALVERADFAQETSSRSTKLIHGGVRYLRQGNLALVRESLRERQLLLRNAPGLVHWREFVIPVGGWWERQYYAAGLKAYDFLAGELGGQSSRGLSRAEALKRLPGLAPAGVAGGVSYWDGQFDDARLALALAKAIFAQGGIAVNYAPVLRLIKAGDRVAGAVIRDVETQAEIPVSARVVINATGVFTDSVRRMDAVAAPELIAPSRGSHVVLPSTFLPGASALMIPKTPDGRVLFAIPWQGRVLVGTTDVPVTQVEAEPRPSDEEVDYLLQLAGGRLALRPARRDILSTFAGLRPLIQNPRARSTAALARDHFIEVGGSGLVTVAGGKWTTCRRMGEDTVDRALAAHAIPSRPCRTETLALDCGESVEEPLAGELSPGVPVSANAVRRQVTEEMARTVEDVLSRRTRCLLLDARAAANAAERVATSMAAELNRDANWIQTQTQSFRSLAARYLPDER